MTEEYWSIDTPDGFKIYGVLNKTDKKKNSKAILYVHGLTGFAYDYAATRMANIFPKFGYDVIRVNLYHWEKGARSLIDCTLKLHAADINAINKHFKKRYKKLYATGHSYGGPSLMEAKINDFAAVSLWDPCFIPEKVITEKSYPKLGKYYASLDGIPIILGKQMIDEAKKFDRDHAIKLAKKCKTPLQVFFRRARHCLVA